MKQKALLISAKILHLDVKFAAFRKDVGTPPVFNSYGGLNSIDMSPIYHYNLTRS